jgi:flagellar hook-basal body complex protein FliE
MVRGVSGLAAYGAQAAQATRAAGTAGAAAGAKVEGPAGTSFADTLSSGLQQVEGQVAASEDALSLLASGEQVDLHGTMIELEKADIALRTMVSVRDKVIAAYEQVMNMTV